MKEEETIKNKLLNLIMNDGDLFEVCKMQFPPNTNQREIVMSSYMKGAKAQRDYFLKIIEEL